MSNCQRSNDVSRIFMLGRSMTFLYPEVLDYQP